MWFDDLPPDSSWSSLWHSYVLCGNCGGIRHASSVCPACGSPAPSSDPARVRLADGTEMEVPSALMGAEGRYEDWVYLKMLEREWKRPLTDADEFSAIPATKRPAARGIIVLLFWSYFETRIERLLRESMRGIPGPIVEDLLRRYGSIGPRLDRLYGILFSSTYWSDLTELGFTSVSQLLQNVHQSRNAFAHGQPEAITETLVADLVEALKDEHASWIAVFNKRASRRSGAAPGIQP